MTSPKPITIVLINPPVAKVCEPPASIARLAGALEDNGVACELLDLNLICMVGQFDLSFKPDDRWSRRAYKNRHTNITEIRSSTLYQSPDRYQRVVRDLGRVLSMAGKQSGCDISLANFSDPDKSPLSSSDLLESAEKFAVNHFFPLFKRILKRTIDNHRPTSVGISFSYLSQALTGFAVAGFIRRHYPHIQIIAGGGLISSWMSSPTWNDPFKGLIDHCISGPGERSLLSLLGKEADEDLGRFNFDAFEQTTYLAPGAILPYVAAHGCYWKKCRFCPDFAEDSCYATKPVTTVIDEIHELVTRYNPALLHLLDNAISPALLKKLAASAPVVAWYGFARFEKDLEDLNFCRALKRSGCTMLKLGLESGSQQVLDKLNKGINLDRVAKILDNLYRVGIGTYVYLLFGTPAETEIEALKTMDFVCSHADAITFFNLAIFNMPVCSPEAVHLENRFSDGDLSLYCNFTHPAGWDRKAVRTFLQKRFRKDARIRKIDQRNPGVFGSNHAPFFVR